MKKASTWYYIFILGGLMSQIIPIKSDINLDDKRLIRWTKPSFTYQPETKQLHITLSNVDIQCCGGCKSHGRPIGTYLNPKFRAFQDSFDLQADSPLCRVYRENKK